MLWHVIGFFLLLSKSDYYLLDVQIIFYLFTRCLDTTIWLLWVALQWTRVCKHLFLNIGVQASFSEHGCASIFFQTLLWIWPWLLFSWLVCLFIHLFWQYWWWDPGFGQAVQRLSYWAAFLSWSPTPGHPLASVSWGLRSQDDSITPSSITWS